MLLPTVPYNLIGSFFLKSSSMALNMGNQFVHVSEDMLLQL